VDDPLVAVDQALTQTSAPLATQVCLTKGQMVVGVLALAGLVALLTGVFDQKVKLQGSYGNNRVEALVPKGWLRRSGDMGWG
jgi:hypothetical protein